MKSLVWFRNDLRITDNPTLIASLESSEFVAGLYCFESKNNSFLGISCNSAQRRAFVEETLVELKKNLLDINVPLFVIEHDTLNAICDFVKFNEITKIFISEEIAYNEVKLETELRNRIGNSVEFVVVHSRNLIPPEALPFSTNRIPDIFTHFRKTAEEYFHTITTLPAPSHKNFSNLEAFFLPPNYHAVQLGISEFKGKMFIGGESEGLKRLDFYLFTSRAIKTYKETRNGLLSLNDSTKFSPYLATGALSARTVYKEIRRYESRYGKNQSTYWVLFELLWRDFFWYIFKKHGSKLFSINGIGYAKFEPKAQPEENFEKWCNGSTGYPLIDAAMIELKTTGFQSNRMRQNTASFLAKNMGYDWRKGAVWFESQLLDYDVYSNYGNWAYCSGVGNDPKIYRLFNNLLQAEKYDPHGAFIRRWIPILNEVIPPELYFPTQATREQVGYSLPIQDLAITPRPGPDSLKGEQLSLFD